MGCCPRVMPTSTFLCLCGEYLMLAVFVTVIILGTMNGAVIVSLSGAVGLILTKMTSIQSAAFGDRTNVLSVGHEMAIATLTVVFLICMSVVIASCVGYAYMVKNHLEPAKEYPDPIATGMLWMGMAVAVLLILIGIYLERRRIMRDSTTGDGLRQVVSCDNPAFEGDDAGFVIPPPPFVPVDPCPNFNGDSTTSTTSSSVPPSYGQVQAEKEMEASRLLLQP